MYLRKTILAYFLPDTLPKLRGSSNHELNSGVQPEGHCSTDMAIIALGNYFRSSKEYKNKADT